MAIKLLAVLFTLVAIRRVVVRYRRGGALTVEFVMWFLIFSGIGVVVFIPHVTDRFAHWIGVSSGFNALTFLAISGLLYSVYRLLSRLQNVERDITRLVRAQAIDRAERVTPALDAPAPATPPPPPAK
ncbi:MAG TPA: DUF2304 domain-containing protein [Polyangia bacterium]|nr:DUF2304 domain-containing protein [Polyangia bacterium]